MIKNDGDGQQCFETEIRESMGFADGNVNEGKNWRRSFIYLHQALAQAQAQTSPPELQNDMRTS